MIGPWNVRSSTVALDMWDQVPQRVGKRHGYAQEEPYSDIRGQQSGHCNNMVIILYIQSASREQRVRKQARPLHSSTSRCFYTPSPCTPDVMSSEMFGPRWCWTVSPKHASPKRVRRSTPPLHVLYLPRLWEWRWHWLEISAINKNLKRPDLPYDFVQVRLRLRWTGI